MGAAKYQRANARSTVRIPTLGNGLTLLNANSVQTQHLQDYSVTLQKLAPNGLWRPPTQLALDANYTITLNDRVILCAPTVNRTITLPSAVGIAGAEFEIRKIVGWNGANYVYIATTGGQLIGGTRVSGEITLYAHQDYVVVYSDGTNWQIKAKKETASLYAAGNAAMNTTSASNTYSATGTQTFTLPRGQWLLGARTFWKYQAGDTAWCVNAATGFFLGTGTNTGVAPASLNSGGSMQVDSGQWLYSQQWGDGQMGAATTFANNVYLAGPTVECTVSVFTPVQVYFVPHFTYFTTQPGANSSYGAVLYARRIW